MKREELKFWYWFESNHEKFTYLDNIEISKKELLLDELLMHLHKYCNYLYFQIGTSLGTNKRELIITAEGNVEYFKKVEKLVSSAPKIENWEIIPFKPPRGIDFVTEYEGLIFDPKKMKFIPFENAKHPGLLGVKILMDNFLIEYKKKITFAMHQVLDSILGEKATALEIQFLEVGLLNRDGTEDNLIDLVELPKYIEWKKKSGSKTSLSI